MDPQSTGPNPVSRPISALCSESRKEDVLTFAWCFYVFAVLALSLRLYSKSRFTKSGIAADDWCAAGSVAAGTIGIGFFTKWADVGLGTHLACLDVAHVRETLKWNLLCEMEANAGLCFIKVSVCVRVLQLLKRTRRPLRIFIWYLLGFIVATHLGAAIVDLMACMPLKAFWDRQVKGKCLTQKKIYIGSYVPIGFDVFTDLMCAFLPTYVVWTLQMKLSRKIAASILFGIGSVVALCAVAKALVLHTAYQGDFTWNTIILSKWATAEHALGVILTSIPAIRRLVEHIYTTVRRRLPIQTPPFSDDDEDDRNVAQARRAKQRFPISMTCSNRTFSTHVRPSTDKQSLRFGTDSPPPVPSLEKGVDTEAFKKLTKKSKLVERSDAECRVEVAAVGSEGSSIEHLRREMEMDEEEGEEGEEASSWVVPVSIFKDAAGYRPKVPKKPPSAMVKGTPVEDRILFAVCKGTDDVV